MNIHKHILCLEPGLYQETMMSLYHISNAQTHLKLEKCLEAPADQRNQMIIIVLIDLIRELKNLPAYGGADFDSEYESFNLNMNDVKFKIEDQIEEFESYVEDQKKEINRLKNQLKRKVE